MAVFPQGQKMLSCFDLLKNSKHSGYLWSFPIKFPVRQVFPNDYELDFRCVYCLISLMHALDMRVLVTGGTGLVGHGLKRAVDAEPHPDDTWVYLGSKEADLRQAFAYKSI